MGLVLCMRKMERCFCVVQVGHGLNHLELTAQKLNLKFTKRNRYNASGIQLELVIPNMYFSTDETRFIHR